MHRLARLLSVISGHRAMLIVLQDYPDPDAVASAAALKELAKVTAGLTVSIACGGVVGRTENRALVRYLDMNLLSLMKIDPEQYDIIAMVDTQPATGNNALAHDLLPNIVIDHHPINTATRRVEFHDVRKHYGATSTIMYEYLKAAGVGISAQLSTSLVYGIRSDTDDLGREASASDVAAFVSLYPSVNHRIMGRIQMSSLPDAYFNMLHDALVSARKYGPCMIAGLGQIDNPDMIAEAADLFLRSESCLWGFCYGYYEGRMLLSLRTVDPVNKAGHVMKRMVSRKGTGGGHGAMAGGQISVAALKPGELRRLEHTVINRLLKTIGLSSERPVKLIKASS